MFLLLYHTISEMMNGLIQAIQIYSSDSSFCWELCAARYNFLLMWRIVRHLYSQIHQPVLHITYQSSNSANSRLIHLSRFATHFLDDVTLAKRLDKQLIVLPENELVERHVRGWGGGGQKINKTANCVVLTHSPTGLTVRVHDSRSLLDNITIARARLRMKVDIHIRGEESVLKVEEHKKALKKHSKTRSAKKNLELKKKFKYAVNSDGEDDIVY